ncbi:potassium channel family protein [Methylohalobius crimeensis]|uniref:potassium channel family protein n=1 Tax=Methylohalobius crimeensis TaxID=244365 RepID=UPI0003B39FD5|nr:TrkA family potassium uptake protein [Methylohalobius crimeensis]
MRVVFIGASATNVACARLLIKRRHEVIIIERNQDRIQELSENMDCGFIHGDGTHPHILEETEPHSVDVLICTTGIDQNNILASLVGKTMKIGRIFTTLEDPEFERVAIALGLTETLVPVRTISRYLADAVEGRDILQLATLLKGDAYLFSVVIPPEWAGSLTELPLPEKQAHPAWLYRGDRLVFVDASSELEEGDELVIVALDSKVAEGIRQELLDKAAPSQV